MTGNARRPAGEPPAAPAPGPGPDAVAPPPESGAGREARRLAAAILEVLAGLRGPAEAARSLGISLARYYQLEGRALAGLVAGCEARRRGRQPAGDPDGLRRECERLRRECARQQALARATRKAAGLAEAAPPAPPPPAEPEARPRRRRRPKARALKMAARLLAEPAAAPAPAADGPGPAQP
jgi:hypothetical protein